MLSMNLERFENSAVLFPLVKPCFLILLLLFSALLLVLLPGFNVALAGYHLGL